MIKKKKIIRKTTPIVPEVPVDEAEMTVKQPPMDENEMRNDLEGRFEDLETKNSALESQKYVTNNSIRQLKLDILKELFDFLQKNGVDPNDLASINQFLQKLGEQDPDFITLFELVLNGLSPEGQTAPTGGEMTAPAGGLEGNMASMPSPVAPGASIPPTPPASAPTPPTPASTPPAFLERFNNLKQRGII